MENNKLPDFKHLYPTDHSQDLVHFQATFLLQLDIKALTNACLEGNIKNAGSRSTLWWIFLKVISHDSTNWLSELTQNRQNYYKL